jgi:hypothetical protein
MFEMTPDEFASLITLTVATVFLAWRHCDCPLAAPVGGTPVAAPWPPQIAVEPIASARAWHLTGIPVGRQSRDRGVRGPAQVNRASVILSGSPMSVWRTNRSFTQGVRSAVRRDVAIGDCGSLLVDRARPDLSGYRRCVPLRLPVQLDHTAPASGPARHASGIRRLTFAARITVTARCAA